MTTAFKIDNEKQRQRKLQEDIRILNGRVGKRRLSTNQFVPKSYLNLGNGFGNTVNDWSQSPAVSLVEMAGFGINNTPLITFDNTGKIGIHAVDKFSPTDGILETLEFEVPVNGAYDFFVDRDAISTPVFGITATALQSNVLLEMNNNNVKGVDKITFDPASDQIQSFDSREMYADNLGNMGFSVSSTLGTGSFSLLVDSAVKFTEYNWSKDQSSNGGRPMVNVERLESNSSSLPSTGFIRMGNGESMAWLSNPGGTDLTIGAGLTNDFVFGTGWNGIDFTSRPLKNLVIGDDLDMNGNGIVGISNLDLDGVSATIEGVANLQFFQTAQSINSLALGLTYQVSAQQKHEFVIGGVPVAAFEETTIGNYLTTIDSVINLTGNQINQTRHVAFSGSESLGSAESGIGMAAGCMKYKTSLTNQTHDFLAVDELLASISRIGSNEGQLSVHATVSDILQADEQLFFTDSGFDPALGQIRRNGADIKVFSGGQVQNLSDIADILTWTQDHDANDFSLIGLKNLDFDDPISTIEGLANLQFFQTSQSVNSLASGLTYQVGAEQKHEFAAGGFSILSLEETTPSNYLINSNAIINVNDNEINSVKHIAFSGNQNLNLTTEAGIGHASSAQQMIYNVPLTNHVHTFTAAGELLASISRIGSNEGQLSVHATVSDILQADEQLFFTDSGFDPLFDGEIRRNNSDVKVFSGGAVRNLSDIGSGSGLTEPLIHSITTLTPITKPGKTNIDSATSNAFKITLDRDIELDILNPNATKMEFLHIAVTQDPVTARTITWPASVQGVPSIDGTLGSETTISLFNMADGKWRFVSSQGGVIGGSGGSGDMVLADVQTVTGAKTFNDDILKINNPTADFQYVFSSSAITANRIVTLPLLTGDDQFSMNLAVQEFSNKTIDADLNFLTNIGSSEVKSELITGLAPDATPDGLNDFVMVYDASATALKKVLLNNLPGGGTLNGLTDVNLNLPISDGSFLVYDAVNSEWVNSSSGGGGSSPLTTKGDLFGYSTTDARLPVGTDGQVLTANSAVALGVEWVTGGGGGSQTSFTDLEFDVHDDVTPTKKLVFSLAGLTAGTNSIGPETTSGIRAWTLPNIDGILMSTEGSQTIKGQKTFENGNLLVEDSDGSNTGLIAMANLTSDKIFTFPNATGNVILDSATQTLSNKTFSSTIQADSSNPNIGSVSNRFGTIYGETLDLSENMAIDGRVLTDLEFTSGKYPDLPEFGTTSMSGSGISVPANAEGWTKIKVNGAVKKILYWS